MPGAVDVTVAGNGGRNRRNGIHLHRSRTLTRALTTKRRGIPVTTPARTISDLERVVSAKDLRRAIRQASVLGFPIDDEATSDRTRSELERRFLRLCKRHNLPTPGVNVRIGPFEVDFLWRDHRLIVETDGYRFHRGRAAFEDDHARDLELRRLGYEIVRLSYRQVVDEPESVISVLEKMLS